jgi:alanine transaminase
VKAQLYKLASISLCSNTPGQVMTGLMVAPPLPSDPSGATYAKEREDTLASLARRAAKVIKRLISVYRFFYFFIHYSAQNLPPYF